MKNLWSKYKNYIFLLAGSNIGGILNLLFMVYVYKASSANVYNQFVVLSSFFLILTAPGKIVKNVANTYGDRLYLKQISKLFSQSSIKMVAFALVLLLTIFLVFNIHQKTVHVVVILAALVQIPTMFFGGLIQYKGKFAFTSLSYFLQNLFRLSLSIIVLSSLANFGIWTSSLLSSIILLYIFVLKYKSETKNTKTTLKFKFDDIMYNIFLLLLIELLLNIDTLIVSYRLPQAEAYFYNTILIIKRTFLTIVVGITPILLSQVKDNKKDKFDILAKNVFASLLFSLAFIIILILGSGFITSYFQIEGGDILYYYKIILASFLGVIVLTIATWFASFKENKIRLALITVLGIYIILYTIFVNTINKAIDYYIIGNVLVIILQIVLIFLGRKDLQSETLMTGKIS
jgi:O-antigen/teichoic acid export membrane protein